MKRGSRNVLAGMTAIGLVFATPAVRADAVEDFYADRQVTMLLSTGAGGTYAAYAIAFAPHLADHIPGKPKIIVDYMPGAGGIRAMNYLYSNAPQDGSVIAIVHSSVPYAPLYGIAAARFDSMQMNWIGGFNSTTGICVAWHESDIKTWDDLFDKEFFVGSTGAGSQMEILPQMINKLFGTNITVIPGYTGGNDVFVAMERGEVDGRCGGLVSGINSTRPDWFAEKKVAIPVQIALERSPKFPDVPALGEFAEEPGGQLAVYGRLTFGCLLDCIDKPALGRGLQEVPIGASLDGLGQVFVTKAAEDHDPHLRVLLLESARGVNAVHPGQAYIHEYHLGRGELDLLQCLFGTIGLSYYHYLFVQLQQAPDAFPDDMVIFHQKNGYLCHSLAILSLIFSV